MTVYDRYWRFFTYNSVCKILTTFMSYRHMYKLHGPDTLAWPAWLETLTLALVLNDNWKAARVSLTGAHLETPSLKPTIVAETPRHHTFSADCDDRHRDSETRCDLLLLRVTYFCVVSSGMPTRVRLRVTYFCCVWPTSAPSPAGCRREWGCVWPTSAACDLLLRRLQRDADESEAACDLLLLRVTYFCAVSSGMPTRVRLRVTYFCCMWPTSAPSPAGCRREWGCVWPTSAACDLLLRCLQRDADEDASCRLPVLFALVDVSEMLSQQRHLQGQLHIRRVRFSHDQACRYSIWIIRYKLVTNLKKDCSRQLYISHSAMMRNLARHVL